MSSKLMGNPSGRILLVEDDASSLESTKKLLELSGFDVDAARDGEEALNRVRSGTKDAWDVIVSDIRMPRLSGMDFLRALHALDAGIPVVLMTAYGEISDAVEAMKLGAVDFLSKPFKRQSLLKAVESALQRRQRAEVRSTVVRSEIRGIQGIRSEIIGHSAVWDRMIRTIEQVAPTQATVLIQGESGTGKELVAQWIHRLSPRAAKPFLAINCAALPENLMESELFGYEKNAFTGAQSAKMGIFEAAEGGVIFLDEIGDLPLALQAKLLRVLQEGEVRRVGAHHAKKIDVRVLAATHRSITEMVKSGTFREDLLYRLQVIEIRVPSLRERIEDIEDLLQAFVTSAALRHGKEMRGWTRDFYQTLVAYRWPGNVRELYNIIERAVVLSEGTLLSPRDLPDHVFAGKLAMEAGVLGALLPGAGRTDRGDRADKDKSVMVRIGTPLKEVEDLLIQKTLEATEGDKNMTAKLLGINSRTLYRRAKKESERDAE